MESDNISLINKENSLQSNVDIKILWSNEQPQKKVTFTKLLSINALVCGVEIVASSTFTFIPPLLLKSGFSESLMTTVLGVAPFMDMITVPLLAEWSDHSTLRMGKRRPIIIGLSLILLFSLVTISFSSRIATTLEGTKTGIWHMLTLATGVILLDYSYQAIYNPCEALLSDMLTTYDKRIQTMGFSFYSACLSLGCIIGYLIVCVKWTSIIPLDLLQEQMCFLITTLLFILCLAVTLSNKEVPNRTRSEAITNFDSCSILPSKIQEKNFMKRFLSMKRYYSFLKQKYYQLWSLNGDTIIRLIEMFPRSLLFCFTPLFKLGKNLIYLGSCLLKGVILLPVGCYRRVYTAPAVIRRIFFFELFGWTTVHCHDRFFTDFVGQYVYEGNPNAEENTNEATLYDEGIMMGSWCLFLQYSTACLYAFFLQQPLVHLMGPRPVFVGGTFVLFFSMILSLALPSVAFLKFTTALSGIGTVALTTTPNMLATLYLGKKDMFMTDLLKDQEEFEALQERGVATEVAVLDMSYYLSQIILSFFLAPLIEVFRSSLLYMVVPVVTSGIALYYASKVIFTPQDFQLALKGKF